MPRRGRHRTIAGALAMTMFCALFVSLDADVANSTDGSLHVPAQYASIQSAVNAANDGDVVLIAPGVYYENVVISGKSVTIASEFLTTGDEARIDATVIDGGGGTFVVRVATTAGPQTSIVGLTLRNANDGISGEASFSFLNGRIHGTSDGIDYENNAPGTPSGGVVRDSVFELNSDDGIDLDDDVAVLIENNIIRDNTDDGIEVRNHEYVGPTLDIVIRGNTISGNGEDGIQLIDGPDLSDRSIRIERNLLVNNDAAGIGMMPGMETIENFGGADLAEYVVIANNTIVSNDHGVTGGDNTVLVNNVIANNLVGIKRTRIDSAAFYNIFSGNGTDSVDAIVDPATTYSADPLLNPDYTLDPFSPAIDSGTAYLEWNGVVVLDLQPTDYVGPAPDLGVFEYGGNLPPTVDAGLDQAIGPAETAMLLASTTDDGLPDPPGTIALSWNKTSGPGTVTFSTPNAVATDADFSIGGTYVLRLSVSDSSLIAFDELTVTVGVVANQPPTLATIAAQVTDEGTLLSFTATADDPDDDNLTFSLEGAVPTGASIDPDSGIFGWTPTESQGPAALSVTVRVTDDGVSPEFDEQQVSITVDEINEPPALLTPLGGLRHTEGEGVSSNLYWSDTDLPANTLTWQATGLPPEVTIDPISGAISGTIPIGAASGSPYTTSITATDNGTPPLADTAIFSWVVDPSNLAPVLTAIGDQPVQAMYPLSFTATATDPNGDGLTFSLIGAPVGASITGAGLFEWTPSFSQGPANYAVTVRVTDDGSPVLYDEESITVTVAAPPNTFTDDDGSLFEGDIEWLAERDITFGCNPEGTLFCPNDPVTRAQMASFLVRAFEIPATGGNRFTDVSGTHSDAINALAEAGITLGCNADGTLYCPDALVSRAQMASFLAAALHLTPIPGDVFIDVSGVHEPNINAINGAGITLGCDTVGPMYCPLDNITRAQMAAFIHRAVLIGPGPA